MAKTNQTTQTIDPTSVLGSIHVPTDTLQTKIAGLANTSQKIRYLIASAPDQTKAVAYAYNMLKKYGVTTKEGGEIRYQHVRNVAMTKLSGQN